MSKISLIMLSWERVSNVLNSINNYLSYKLIDEIIIFNNNNKYDLRKLGNKKVTIIESSKDMGLYSRFAAAGLAHNPCIMHCDDDLLIPEETVNELYRCWVKSPKICHGTQGRQITDKYETGDVYGNVPIVLTRCMLVSKSNCIQALGFSSCFQDLICEPEGNGEDIILSFISMSHGKSLNKSYRLPYFNYDNYKDEKNGLTHSIHRRWKHHLDHRTNIINRCRSLLMPAL